MDVTAKLSYLRMSDRKVRLVANLVRGLDVEPAENQLRFSSKRAAHPLMKLLHSAAANAVNNNKLKKEELYIKTITVDQGPSLKRFRPRAFGTAAPIKKHSCHVTIVLSEKHPSVHTAKKESAKTTSLPVMKKKDIKEHHPAKVEGKKPRQLEKKVLTRTKRLGDHIVPRQGTS